MAKRSKWFILRLSFKVQKTILQSYDSYPMQKSPLKNDTLLKSGKIGYFAKAIVRQNRQNWPTLWLNFEDQK